MTKKKILSLFLVLSLAATMVAGCGKKTTNGEENTTVETTTEADSQTQKPTDETKTTESNTVLEEVPAPVYYYSMDKADDKPSIQPTKQDTTADQILYPVDEEKVYIPGVKGECLYVNGATGYRLTDVNGVGETYTVSYWVYVRRLANFMPTIQFGPDVHGDATGMQHWVNFTKQTWADDGNATFPVIWSDDVSTGAFPFFAEEEGSEKYNEWTHIALVVDADNVNDEGTMINGELYINGQLVAKKDAEGNIKPCEVVVGAMSESDNFDFLIGVNYWDAIFKGGIDEVKVFDKALSAGQIATLYAEGDPTVPFDEPEHDFTIVPNEAAIDTLGTTDYVAAFGEKYFAPVAIEDGKSMEVKLANWSDGQDSKNNYVLVFTENESEDPLKDAVAKVYADADGDGTFTYTWGNWKTWCNKVMKEADVTIKIDREGSVLSIVADNCDYNGAANTMRCTLDTGVSTDLYCYITNQNSYVELLSVKDVTPIEVDLSGKVVGSTALDSGFWAEFSDIWAVPAGSSKTVKFKNYTAGDNNWENFVLILQSTAEGHSAETEGYKEYAVLRADNWGWGENFGNTDADKEATWNWDTFIQDINGADVEVTVANENGVATVDITVTGANGAVNTQKYKNIAVDGDLYMTFTLEKSFLVFEPVIVGSTALDSGFWTEFSDIWAVPAGSSKTVEFTNYTAGDNNWENFVAILQSTAEGHSADTEGYKEYAVLRADNWGWGENFANTDADKEATWNWDTFIQDINGANVVLTVTNENGVATVDITVTSPSGVVNTQKYKNIAVDGDVYLTFTLEKSYLVFK